MLKKLVFVLRLLGLAGEGQRRRLNPRCSRLLTRWMCPRPRRFSSRETARCLRSDKARVRRHLGRAPSSKA